MNCTIVAELIKKSRTNNTNLVNMFIENGLEAIVPKALPERSSNLSEEQKETLKADVVTHPCEL